MSRQVFRSVHPTHLWAMAGKEPATYDGPFHRAGERVVYAWSRSELAAMSTALLCAGIEPVEMLWERLWLPGEATIVDLGDNESVSPDLMARLIQNEILGAWVPTSLSGNGNGMALVMNPAHAKFHEIKVLESRFITRDRG